MDNLRRLGNKIHIDIPTDEKGLTGRQCPNKSCNQFFKIKCGTGIKGDDLPCHCPYCGHTAIQFEFTTEDQLEYAKSVAARRITDAIFKDLKKFEFNLKPKSSFSIGMSLKVKRPHVSAIKNYQEEELETEVVCSNCGLHYAIYGAFAYCPDCSVHNSFQILEQNFHLIEKQLLLAEREGGELEHQLVEDSLENAVAAFDAFGRKNCEFFAKRNSPKVDFSRISFQNLESAKKKLLSAINLDISSFLSGTEWQELSKSFQKRHVLSHKLGIVDQEYIDKTGDASVQAGRKLRITASEVLAILSSLKTLGKALEKALK